jgi:hypothetical protein
MSEVRRLVVRLINAIRSRRASALHREIVSHLTLIEDEYVRRGLSVDAPRSATLGALRAE